MQDTGNFQQQQGVNIFLFEDGIRTQIIVAVFILQG